MTIKTIYCLCILLVLTSCTMQKNASTTSSSSISSLKLVNIFEIPYNQPFNNTTIGGLSSIDYNRKEDAFYFICDDRSKINPARFYRANIAINEKGIDTVIFTDVKFLHQQNGALYPNSNQNPYKTPDPESLRFNSKTNQFIWSSEGERNITNKDTILNNPSITIIDTIGNFIEEYQLPDNILMSVENKGPRINSVFEGLSFNKDYSKLYASIEQPLLQDGDEPDTLYKTCLSRIFVFDTKTKKAIAQFAYPLDAVAHAPRPANKPKMNGISEILWLNKNQLLIMERSYSFGVFANTIKIYIADLSSATDVSNIYSLKESNSFKPIAKKLLFNSDSLKKYVDNVEGLTFGPKLSNGKNSLLWVVDNNFSAIEQSQVFLFEIEE